MSNIFTCHHLFAFHAVALPTALQCTSAGLYTCCNASRDAQASVVLRFSTASIGHPVWIETTLVTFQLVYACSSVCRTLLLVISCWLLEQITCSQRCSAASSCSIWGTCQPPIPTSLQSTLRRSLQIYQSQMCKFACVLCCLRLLVPCLPVGQPICARLLPSVPGPSGLQLQCRGSGGPYHALCLLLLVAALALNAGAPSVW